MPKAEISWKRQTPDGDVLQCYAQHVGKEWRFFQRPKRFDRWQAVRQPPLEDWLALLDSVRWRRLVFAPDGKLRFRKSYQRSTGALQRTSATELVEPIKTRQSAARTTRPS